VIVSTFATFLSDSRPFGARKGRISALARLSLGALSLAMLPSCLVDDPPPYAEPQRTPPRLVYHLAWPPLGEIIKARAPDLVPFSIPVASEDVGEPLVAQFYVNEQFNNYVTLSPSTADVERTISFSYPVQRLEGYCHRFRIRVGHASNLPDGNGAPVNNVDLAEVYWLAYLNVPSDQMTGPDCFFREMETTP
jgi:hypothetical protein